MDQSILTLLKVMLATVMFGMGLGLTIRDFRRVMVTPWQVLIGTAGHFILMPLAAFIVVKALNLPYELAIGVIIVGSCPSGTTSNLINYFAKADVALAIIITSLSTLLSPLLTPLIVGFLGSFLDAPAGTAIAVSYKDMIGLVIVIIGIPVGIGMLVRRYAPKVAGVLEKVFKVFGIVFLLFMIILVLYQNKETFWGMVATVGVAVVAHNTIALLLGYFVPKLLRVPEAQSRTIAIEMGVQNTTLGMTLAFAFFNGTVAMPAALFSLWMYIVGMTLALIWSRRPAPLNLGSA